MVNIHDDHWVASRSILKSLWFGTEIPSASQLSRRSHQLSTGGQSITPGGNLHTGRWKCQLKKMVFRVVCSEWMA
jgi:hypothetical protein